jgi:hypothetical protein
MENLKKSFIIHKIIFTIFRIKAFNFFSILQNKEAIKKLENVKKDHQKRIDQLKRTQVRIIYFLHFY